MHDKIQQFLGRMCEPSVYLSVTQSVMQLRCAKTAEWIKVLIGIDSWAIEKLLYGGPYAPR